MILVCMVWKGDRPVGLVVLSGDLLALPFADAPGYRVEVLCTSTYTKYSGGCVRKTINRAKFILRGQYEKTGEAKGRTEA